MLTIWTDKIKHSTVGSSFRVTFSVAPNELEYLNKLYDCFNSMNWSSFPITADRKTEPTISKMEQVEDEPQTETQTETQNSNLTFEKGECAKEYEELGLKELKELIKADRKTENSSEKPNNCEPQTFEKPTECLGCLYSDLDKAFHPCASCADFGKYVGEESGKDEPQIDDFQDWKDRMWTEAVVTEPQTEQKWTCERCGFENYANFKWCFRCGFHKTERSE